MHRDNDSRPVAVPARFRRTGCVVAATLVSGQLLAHTALMPGSAGDQMATPVMSAGRALPFHLPAALVVGWWLRRGEQRLWKGARRVMAAVCRCVCHLLHAAAPVDTSGQIVRVVTVPEAGLWRARIVLRHAIVLRAPPALR